LLNTAQQKAKALAGDILPLTLASFILPTRRDFLEKQQRAYAIST
jgi:hypothetical protein